MLRAMRLVLALMSAVVLSGAALGFVRYLSESGAPLRWFERQIALHVAPAPPSLDADDAMRALSGAISQWTEIDCDPPGLSAATDESATLDDGDGKNSMVWFTDREAWNARFSVTELARTLLIHKVQSGTIVDADIAVNLGGFPFSAGPICVLGRYDLQSVLTHELGHFFGLDHSSVASASMTAKTEPGDCEMRTLDADDIAGFCASYDRPAEVEVELAAEASPEATPEAAVEPAPDAVVERVPAGDDGCHGGLSGVLGLWALAAGGLRVGRRSARLRSGRRASA